MTLESLTHGAWLTGLVLNAVVAVILLFKRMWGSFPMFTIYALYSLLETGTLFTLYHHRDAYFYGYVISQSISVVLALGLVYEIFAHLFAGYPALHRLAWLNFRLVLLLLVALGVVICARSSMDRKDVGNALFVVEEAARALEVGLITFLFLFSSVFGLHWRQSVFGLAVGLGVPIVFQLLTATVGRHVSQIALGSLTLAEVVAGVFGLFIWLFYLLMRERGKDTELPKRAQLEQWNQAIMELINQ